MQMYIRSLRNQTEKPIFECGPSVAAPFWHGVNTCEIVMRKSTFRVFIFDFSIIWALQHFWEPTDFYINMSDAQ